MGPISHCKECIILENMQAKSCGVVPVISLRADMTLFKEGSMNHCQIGVPLHGVACPLV